MSLRDFQAALLAKGYAPGPLDGAWGAQTEAAAMRALATVAPANAPPPVSAAAFDLIREFESFRSTAYQDSGGVWTIGYGTTAAAGVGIEPRPRMTITQVEAEIYLRRAVEKFAARIRLAIVGPTTPGEDGAMVSLAYNIGPDAFLRSSVLRHFNAGDKASAAAAFRYWNKSKGEVLVGLVRRRAAEKALFLS